MSGSESVSFRSLGIIEELCETCEQLGFKSPTEIQRESIPVALEGRDIIALAQTGSGKTAAFALPILQALLEKPQGLFCCVLTPTRELAFQISEQFETLGSAIGVKCAVIVGGVSMVTQAIALSKSPHIVVCTPGRLVDHLENTKGFGLKDLKYLVMDEADRLLTMDFGADIEKILKVVPKNRRTYLFSATMTSKVAKLQRASLQDPVKIEVSSKYATVDTLVQTYMFIPAKYKECYLAYLVKEFSGSSIIIFVSTCNTSQRLALFLRNLGFLAIPINGQLGQTKRLGALEKFKSKSHNILIATDVASRGLDIPCVDVVINYDVPMHMKNYIHRVGRTARAGRTGRAITVVTQYDVELYKKVEEFIDQKLESYKYDEENVMVLYERCLEAQRYVAHQMKEMEKTKKNKKHRDTR